MQHAQRVRSLFAFGTTAARANNIFKSSKIYSVRLKAGDVARQGAGRSTGF